jgi:hypothetical protein
MANRPGDRSPPPTLSSYLTRIARLGGYLARASDPPPGATVVWRGWSRLMDLKLGATVADPIRGSLQVSDGHLAGWLTRPGMDA